MTAASGADQPTLRDPAAVLAHHAFSHVNSDGWTVCLCGHVAVDDDDDGSHARHQAAVLLPLIEADRERAKAEAERELLYDVAADITCGLNAGVLDPATKARQEIARDLRDRAEALRGSTGGAAC